VRWLLDVVDRGGGKKMLTQDRQIRRSLRETDATYKKVGVAATSAGARQAAASREVATSRSREAKSTSTTAAAVQELSAAQGRALQLGSRLSVTSTKTAAAYDRQAAAARRAAAAERTRQKAMATAIRAPAGAIGRGRGTVGRAGGPALTGGFIAGAALSQTIKFDRAMRNVNSIAQLGERRFQRLSASVRELGGQTAQMPETLAKGLYDLVSSGFDARESMLILEKSARAASAGLTTTEVSTKAVAAVLNAYHLPAQKAGVVSDQLFRTVDRGVISFEDLSQTVGDVLPFAASLGVGLDEVGAATATMTKAGINAPETMTRIKNVMVAMLKPGKGLQQTLKDLGVESGEALIKQKGFQGALDTLVGSTDGSKNAVAKLFPNIRALGGALALTGKNSRSAAQDLEGMRGASGATSRALSQQSKSVSYQWDKLKAKSSGLAIELGEHLVPGAVGAVNALGGFIGQIKSGEGAGGRFADTVGSAAHGIAGVAQAVGPAALGVGKFALDVLELGGNLAGTQGGIVVLSAALGGLAGRFAGMAIASAAAGFKKLADGIRAAGGAMNYLTAASSRNAIGLLAIAVGTVAGALLGLNAATRPTALSTKELADANLSLYDAMKRVEDLDLDARGRRLELRRANLTLATSETELDRARKSGTATPRQIKSAELAVAEARLEVERRTRAVNHIEDDNRNVRKAARLEGEQTIKRAKETVAERRRERDEIVKQIKALESNRRKFGESASAAEAYRKKQEELRRKNQELTVAQDELNSAIGQMHGKDVTIKVRVGAALRALDSVGRRAQEVFDLVGAAVMGHPPPRPHRPARRAPGAFPRFGGRGGGVVPAAVSPGEALRFPNGAWGMVPGARTAADSVHMPLPVDTEVYTDHGQMLLSSGASRSAALATQMPHFQRGGKLRTRLPQWNHRYPAHDINHRGGRAHFTFGQLQAIGEDRGWRPRKAGQWAQISTYESAGGYPGIVAADGGTGLGQITERVMGALGRRWIRELGGMAEMRNPINNAEMSKRLDDHAGGGWGNWFGTKLLRRARRRQSTLGRWARREGQWGTETYYLPWRPAAGPIPASRLNRFNRRQYLHGLSGDAFRTGYEGGVGGQRHLLRVSGVSDLIDAARVELEHPQRRRRVLTGTRALAGNHRPRFLRARSAASAINSRHYPYSSPGNRAIASLAGPLDCSGAVSKVLGPRGLGALSATQASGYFKSWGQGGRGKLISTFAKGAYSGSGGHVFMKVGDRYFGTSRSNPGGGAGWLGTSYPTSGYVARHPRGFRRGGVAGRLPAKWRTRAMARSIAAAHGIMPGLRAGGTVRLRRGGRAGGIFNPSGADNLRIDVDRIGNLVGTANKTAELLLFQYAAALDNVREVSYRALVNLRAHTRRSISQLLKGGATRRERPQIQRLRASIDLVEAEMGRRTGLLVRGQQRLAAALERGRAKLDRVLRVQGVDQASSAAVAALFRFEQAATISLKVQRQKLEQALKKAQKAGNRDAAAEIRDQLSGVNDAIAESVTRKFELVREMIRAAAQKRVDAAQFGLSFGQGQLAGLDAQQRLDRTADTPEGKRRRAQAITGMLPAIGRQRDTLYGQYIAAIKVGDIAGARDAYLGAQQAAIDLTNAMADAADLIRDAALQASQDLVDTASHGTTMADLGQQRLELEQRIAGTFDTGGQQRADYIKNTIVPAIDAELAALRAQQATALAEGDPALARQIAEAIAGKDNEKLQAIVDATEQTAENTDVLKELGGSLSFQYGDQDFSDLVGTGTGV
jgi:TP901 family phage tail tape measure protein